MGSNKSKPISTNQQQAHIDSKNSKNQPLHQKSQSRLTRPSQNQQLNKKPATSINYNKLKFMTLNYSGILRSPFQFYPTDKGKTKQYTRMSSIFKKYLTDQIYQDGLGYLTQQQIKAKFKWEIDTIDKDIQSQRYTPIYNKSAGLRQNPDYNSENKKDFNKNINIKSPSWGCGFFPEQENMINNDFISNNKSSQQKQKQMKFLLQTDEQFKHSWKQVFDGLKGDKKYKHNCIKQMMKFDLLCYKTILRFVFKGDFNKRTGVLRSQENQAKKQNKLGIQTDQQFIRSLDSTRYIRFLQRFFNKPFLQQQKKIDQTIKKLKILQIDVIFLQQTSKQLRQKIQHELNNIYYMQSSKGQSLMLININKFKCKTVEEFKSKVQILNNVSWNEDSVGVMIENFIFICAHLSSKKDKNQIQKEQLSKTLSNLSDQYKNHTIVLGGDLNSFLQKVPQNFDKYPEKKSKSTTIKKRTWMQPQVNKAEVVVNECKDQLVSNKKLHRKVVWTIDCVLPDQNTYLPIDQHPYDHFALYAQIQLSESEFKQDKVQIKRQKI